MKCITHILTIYFFLLLCFLTGRTSAQRFNSGQIGIELSSIGRLGIFSPHAKNQRQVYRISLLTATDKDHVFTYIEDQDSITSSRNILSPNESDYEIFGAINNSFSNQPPDVVARFNVYGWKGEAYALVKVTLINKDTYLKGIDAFIGFEFLPQIDSAFQFVTIKYNPEEKIITSFRAPSSTYTGIKMLSNELYSLRIIDWKDYYERGTGSDSLIYSLMSNKVVDTLLTGGQLGASCLFAQNKIHLNLYDSTTVYLALALGSNETEVIGNINKAEMKFLKPLSVERKNNSLLSEFKLEQNYPNPFNPSTVISFNIPQKDHVVLKIYDILGRETSTLLNSDFEKGSYKINFSGSSLPSGTYLYRLETSQHSQSRKMVLRK